MRAKPSPTVEDYQYQVQRLTARVRELETAAAMAIGDADAMVMRAEQTASTLRNLFGAQKVKLFNPHDLAEK